MKVYLNFLIPKYRKKFKKNSKKLTKIAYFRVKELPHSFPFGHLEDLCIQKGS